MTRFAALASLLLILVSCGPRLTDDPLSIAVLDESYSYSLDFDEDSLSFSDDYIFSLVGGDLPDGVYLTSYGTLEGTPEEYGVFEFKAKLYAIDEGYDDDDVDTDSEWYTLLVTEESSNESCPSPSDETTTETYVCLGEGWAEYLAADEEVEFDVNTFVNFDSAEDYEIEAVQFSITYDSDLFEPVDDELNSQILREAASIDEATVIFNNDNPGELTITLQTADENRLTHSGRVLDLPFRAKVDVPAGIYDFTVVIESIRSADPEVELPTNIAIDGELEVLGDVPEESCESEC